MQGRLLSAVAETMDLGFTVTENLDFSKHCEYVANKASRRLFNLFKGLSTSDPQVLVRAYKTYVRPILEYGTSVFNPTKVRDSNKIEAVQNSFTRKVLLRTLNYDYSCVPNYAHRNKLLGLESLAFRRKFYDLIMVYKLIKGFTRMSSDRFFKLLPSVTRGGSIKLSYSRARTGTRCRFFANRAGSNFVRLIKTAVLPEKLSVFKISARKALRR